MGYWRGTSYKQTHSQLYYYRKFASQTALAQKRPVDELWIWSTKHSLSFVWLRSESCQCKDLNFCLSSGEKKNTKIPLALQK